MCDTYLLLFLGLRTCNNQQSDITILPWKKQFCILNYFFCI